MGYRFRSRLEARWAVFFQTLGLQWEYEPEGFDLDGTGYLPDFRVVCGELTHWYEVKPQHIKGSKKFSRFTELINASEENYHRSFTVETHLVSGDPLSQLGLQLAEQAFCPRCCGHVVPDYDFGDEECGFLCEDCDPVTAFGGGNPWELGFAGISFRPHKGWLMAKRRDYEKLLFSLQRAGQVARSARFEHGESPEA